jgi:hypothetical protein
VVRAGFVEVESAHLLTINHTLPGKTTVTSSLQASLAQAPHNLNVAIFSIDGELFLLLLRQTAFSLLTVPSCRPVSHPP